MAAARHPRHFSCHSTTCTARLSSHFHYFVVSASRKAGWARLPRGTQTLCKTHLDLYHKTICFRYAAWWPWGHQAVFVSEKDTKCERKWKYVPEKFAFRKNGHIFLVTSVTSVTMLIINTLASVTFVTACYVFVTNRLSVTKRGVLLQNQAFCYKIT